MQEESAPAPEAPRDRIRWRWHPKAAGVAASTALVGVPCVASLVVVVSTGITHGFDSGSGFGWLIILVVGMAVLVGGFAAVAAGVLACLTRSAEPITVGVAVRRALILVAVTVALMIAWSLLVSD